LDVARARAVENRVWASVVVASKSDPLAALVDPDGRVVSVGLRDRDQLVVGVVNVALARLKEMAPGTHVLVGRQPASYEVLTAPSPVRAG
jgi:hypothetical protein